VARLAQEYAWEHEEAVLQGRTIFSGFQKVNTSIDWLSPWLALVKDWLGFTIQSGTILQSNASIPLPSDC